MKLLKNKAFINGEWVSAINKTTFEVINPTNGKVVGTVPNMDAADTKKAIEAAKEAFKTWQMTTVKERSLLLKKWYELLVLNVDNLNKILEEETGKFDGRFEIIRGNDAVEFYAEEVKRIQGEIISSPYPNKKMYVERQPIGVVGLITPWNVPYLMALRKIAPALAAGCTCVVKPAEDTPLVTLAAMELAHQAGIPKGVINVVTCARENASAIGKALCSSPLVAGISFTGSTAVGKILYEQCAPHIKRIAMELGGNCPFIVFESGNIEEAVQVGVNSKFMISGQACIAPNRFLIHESRYEEFIEKFAEAIKSINLGPLINVNQFNRLSSFLEDAKEKGVTILAGGKPNTSRGELFYEPTLLVNIKKDMRVYKEEIFGPVACIMKFKTEEEAVELANDTEKGLASYFFSEDIAQIFRVSKLLEAGIVWINGDRVIPTEAPFGGIKQSGIGKEGSRYGLDEYTYLKYLCIGGL